MAADDQLLTLKFNIDDFQEFNKDLELWKVYVSRIKPEEAKRPTIEMLQKMHQVIEVTKLRAETLSAHLERFQPEMRTAGGRQQICTQSADSGILSIPSASFLPSEIARISFGDHEIKEEPAQGTKSPNQTTQHTEDSVSLEEND